MNVPDPIGPAFAFNRRSWIRRGAPERLASAVQKLKEANRKRAAQAAERTEPR